MPAYILKIAAPKDLDPATREVLVSVLLRTAARFSFLGMSDWSLDLAAGEKVLGISTEFHDLTRGRTLTNHWELYFAKEKDAALFGELIRNSFAELSVGPVKRQAERDWMKEWRKHYKPFSLSAGGEKIWIYPAWKKLSPKAKKNLFVRIYPGQAFGTGTHGTTSLCLEMFLKYARGPRILDFGAGTGILLFAAEKWFKARKLKFVGAATEVDPVAREQFLKNARCNGSSLKVSAKASGVKKYDFIFANVLAPVLLQEKKFFASHLESEGILVLSGVLWKEQEKFCKEFFRGLKGSSKRGSLEFLEAKQKGDWAAIVARKV